MVFYKKFHTVPKYVF